MSFYPSNIDPAKVLEEERRQTMENANWNAMQLVMKPIMGKFLPIHKTAALQLMAEHFRTGELTFEDKHRTKIMEYFSTTGKS